MRAHAKEMVFPIGASNDGFAQYFSGRSFLGADKKVRPIVEPLSTIGLSIFEPLKISSYIFYRRSPIRPLSLE